MFEIPLLNEIVAEKSREAVRDACDSAAGHRGISERGLANFRPIWSKPSSRSAAKKN